MDQNGRDGFSHSQLTEEVCRRPFACKAEGGLRPPFLH